MKTNVLKTYSYAVSALLCMGLFITQSADAQLYELNAPNGTNVTVSSTESYDTMIIGVDNPDNQYSIISGGQVTAASTVIVGEGTGATNSLLSVSDTGLMIIGSADTNTLPSSGIIVGDSTGTGDLQVGYDSTIETTDLYVGTGTNESGTVIAKNGGDIKVSGDLVIGTTENSNNSVVINDGSALHINDSSNLQVNNKTGATDSINALTIKSGGALMVSGDVDATAASSEEGVNFESGAKLGVGGELTSKNNTLKNGLNVILDDNLSTNHTATWNADFMFVGKSTSDNILTIRNGASASSTNTVRIGSESTSSGNNLIVEGSNSTFNALGDALVGVNGDQNNMTVQDGAAASISGELKIGSSSGAGNEVLIDGSGSSLSVNDKVTIGVNGENNALKIQNGASADFQSDLILGSKSAGNSYHLTDSTNTVAGDFILGETKDASGSTGNFQNDDNMTSGNLGFVEDNAALTNQNLTVGLEGEGSVLVIREGGSVTVTGDAIIGDKASDNVIYLQSGSNTRFNVTGDLTIGKDEGQNRLAIYGGVADIAGSIYMGASTNQHEVRNFIHLETTNATLNVANALHVGMSNSVNEVDLVDGASASMQDLYVGAFEGSSNNIVTITGEHSLLSTTNLTIGSLTGSNNAVNVTSGGTLEIAQDNIDILGTNNTLAIDGGILKTLGWDFAAQTNQMTNIVFNSGSTLHMQGALSGTNRVDGGQNFILDGETADWNTSSNNLYVGYETSNNSLTLTNGADITTGTNLYIGNSSDYNMLTAGTGSTVSVSGDIFVGYKGDNNSLSLTDAVMTGVTNLYVGYESANNDLVLTGTGSTNSVAGDMWVGYKGDGNSLSITNGATLTGMTNLYLGYEAENNNLMIADTDSSISALDNIYVGYEGGNNSLMITNGASVSTETNFYLGYLSGDNSVTMGGSNSTLFAGNDLYIGTNGYNNTMTLTGTGSVLTVGNDLLVGSVSNQLSFYYSSGLLAKQPNLLEVLNGATADIGGDAYLTHAATLKIDSKSQVNVSGNYTQDEYAVLEIGISSNRLDNPNLVVGGEAAFSSPYHDDHEIIKIFNEGVGESNVIKIIQADNFTLDGVDVDGQSFSGTISSNALLGYNISITNDGTYSYMLLDEFVVYSWKEAADLDGQLADVADEIEALAASSNEFAMAMDDIFQNDMTGEEINAAMGTYYGEEQSSIPAHNVINMGVQEVAGQVTKRADSTRSRMGAATAEPAAAQPEGAAGPHEAGQELQGWINGYGTWGSQDASDGFSGYDANISGFMIGADFSVAENILVGIAGGTANGSIDKDTGSSTDTKSINAAIYGSIGTKDWFADASFIYGTSDVDTKMGTTFDTTSDYSAQNFAFYVGGGKEFITEYFLFTPQASVLANSYSQDGYEEKASNAVGREIDSFDAFYFQSSLGCSMAMYMGSEDFTFKPEIRAHWLHEWLGDDETINYNLIGGTETYRLALQAPEKDILKIGIGSAFKFGEYLELRADLDTRRSSSYSDYTLLGSLRYQF